MAHLLHTPFLPSSSSTALRRSSASSGSRRPPPSVGVVRAKIRELFMPALSSTMTEGKIVSWVKSEGDKLSKGESVVVVESDKADMDVETFYDGYLAAVGASIALLAENEDEIEQAKSKAQSPSSSSSSYAKKLAKELKVELGRIVGTGPLGRIVAKDVEAFAASAAAAAAPAAGTAEPVASNSGGGVELGSVVPFTTMQSAVSRNMVESLGVATFRVGYTITTDALDALYKKIKPKGVTMTALLAKATALALVKHPVINSSCRDGNSFTYNSSINIAVAVATEGGLITPVLQDADKGDVCTLSRKLKELVDKAPPSSCKLVNIAQTLSVVSPGLSYASDSMKMNEIYEVGELFDLSIQLLYLLSLLGLLGVGTYFVIRQVLVRRELDLSAKELQEQVRSGDASATELFELGAVMLRRKFYPAATKFLLQAIEKWDGDKQDLAQVYNALGVSYVRDGKVDKGIAQFEMAVKLQPGYVTAWNNLGDAFENKKEYKAALKAFEEVLLFDPNNKIARPRRDALKDQVEMYKGVPIKSKEK